MHAVRRMVLRNISPEEVAEAIQFGEVIEDYPQDKYGPSCLVLGHTFGGRPLHVQCSHPGRPLVKVITVYEPDTAGWDATFKHRIKP